MKRRQFLTLIGGVAAWPLCAGAQQSAKIARIGYLITGSLTGAPINIEAFREGMRNWAIPRAQIL
jgi:hypothetical protein